MAQIKITRWGAYREGDWPFDYDCLMTLKSEDMARRTGDKNIIGLSAYIEIPDNLCVRKGDTVICSKCGKAIALLKKDFLCDHLVCEKDFEFFYDKTIDGDEMKCPACGKQWLIDSRLCTQERGWKFPTEI